MAFLLKKFNVHNAFAAIILIYTQRHTHALCPEGFYNVSLPETVPLQYSCKPKHCSTRGDEWDKCPGSPDACGPPPTVEHADSHRDDTLQLRKDIYKSVIDNFTQKHATYQANVSDAIFQIPHVNPLGTTAQEVNSNPFKWNLWKNATFDRQCDLHPNGSTIAMPNTSTSVGIKGCANVYTQYMLVHDPGHCWPPQSGIPIIANSFTTPAQMLQCYHVVMHMLSAKPPGSYVTQPYEQRDAFRLQYPIITCGNNQKGDKPSKDNKGYPQLQKDEEGGGGTYYSPWTYAENNGMCKYKQEDPDPTEIMPTFKQWHEGKNGTRYGGTVQVEEFGHTIFDVAISQFDPQGWRAVQHAAKLSRYHAARVPAPDWDCFTSATEYFAAGVELVLHNTRIGTNLKARNRVELWQQDKPLYCLVSRYYEINNLWRPCLTGPPKDIFPVDFNKTLCEQILRNQLGVTTFGDRVSGKKASASRLMPHGTGNSEELKARGVTTCPVSIMPIIIEAQSHNFTSSSDKCNICDFEESISTSEISLVVHNESGHVANVTVNTTVKVSPQNTTAAPDISLVLNQGGGQVATDNAITNVKEGSNNDSESNGTSKIGVIIASVASVAFVAFVGLWGHGYYKLKYARTDAEPFTPSTNPTNSDIEMKPLLHKPQTKEQHEINYGKLVECGIFKGHTRKQNTFKL